MLLQFLENGVKLLESLYAGSVRLGKLTEKQATAILGNLQPSLSYEDLKNVDIVGFDIKFYVYMVLVLSFLLLICIYIYYWSVVGDKFHFSDEGILSVTNNS